MKLNNISLSQNTATNCKLKLNCRSVLFGIFGFLCIALILIPIASLAGETTLTPGIRLGVLYDDNIDFTQDSSSADSDFSGSAIPNVTIEYNTERFNINALAEVDFKKYLNDTEYDRTNQRYAIGSKYQIHTKWTFSGNYQFIRDETTDSSFEETGRAFERNRAQRHNARGGLQFALTELSDIGSFVTYRKVDNSGEDDTDYDRYTIELPYTKRFQNQVDSIRLTPAFSHYNSDDNEEADDYRLTFGWKRLISETLTFDMNVGGRYTRVESENGDRNGRFGGLGHIGLAKRGETFSGLIRYSRDIRSTTEGEIINVDRIIVAGDKRITERFGARFRGNAYHSIREKRDEPGDKVVSFELNPAIYYKLSENHSVELSYNYRNQHELDEPGNPMTQRNRVALFFKFSFPQKWD